MTPQNPKKTAPSNKRAGSPLKLHGDLYESWLKAVNKAGKFPKGTEKKDLSEERLTNTLMQKEAPAIAEMWETFTQERGRLSRTFLNTKQQMVAYLLGFHLPNAAKIAFLLRRVEERAAVAKHIAKTNSPVRWHDIGCGTGALGLGGFREWAAHGIAAEQCELNFSDQSGSLLDMVKTLTGELEAASGKPLATLRTHKRPIEALPVDAFANRDAETVSVYSLGYVWNELERNPRATGRLDQIFAGALEREEKALVLWIEPAAQEFSRAMMERRDRLVEQGYRPLYPCPHASPCPMLERTRDWCYSEAEWDRPTPIRKLDHMVGTSHETLKATAMAFVTPKLHDALNRPPLKSQSIVVGRPLLKNERTGKIIPNRIEYLLCNPNGALSKGRLEKDHPAVSRGKTFPS